MRKAGECTKALMVLAVCFFALPAHATLIPPDIAGTSTATLITEGSHDGWYLYEIDIEWDLEGPGTGLSHWDLDGLGTGLSHWDLVLLADCALLDHLIVFDSPAGYSTTETEPSNPTAMGWSGYFNRDGDPGAGIANPVVKYNDPFFPDTAQPGEQGYGTFSFKANIIPEYGTYENALVAKAGAGTDPVYGDLVGAYPSCTIIPEPATWLIFGLGSLLAACHRPRRRAGRGRPASQNTA
jgi:hypothetical protein